jgi:hypothetical protein
MVLDYWMVPSEATAERQEVRPVWDLLWERLEVGEEAYQAA